MSFGGGSAPAAPKLKQVKTDQAAALALKYDTEGYQRSDIDWATRFPELKMGRDFMISDALTQSEGGISSQTTGALETAGLGAEAKKIVGKNNFETARNLGEPILAKENRDRNFAENLLAQNPRRSIGVSGRDVVQIALANTGNANAFANSLYGSEVNSYNASVAQQAQNIGALTSLVSGLATDYSKYYSRYTDPYAGAYPVYTYPGSTGYNADIGSIQPPPG